MLLQIQEPGQSHSDEKSAISKTQAVGIDLGTTHSLVSIKRDNQTQVLPLGSQGSALVPSVVAYHQDQIYVGDAAVALLAKHPESVVSSVKRLMGVLTSDGSMTRVHVGGRDLTPIEVSAHILNHLKTKAEAYLGHPIPQAVITVPAYFSEAARLATRDAAQLAGLEVLRLVNEPTAAALAYGLDTNAEGVYAVYDLGGGTFDISLLRLYRGVFQVLATQGDLDLGGDDFDAAILEYWLKERQVQGLQSTTTPNTYKQLLQVACAAKETLSTEESGTWMLDIEGHSSKHVLDRARLNQLMMPFVERTLQICKEVVSRYEGTIQGVVLVGGSTRMPLVRQRVGEFFGCTPYTDIDPDYAVAIGAALQADVLTGGQDALLIDVTPLSLGLETMGGIVERLIDRNTPIPTTHTQEFTTFQDGQTAILIHVVQGEREFAADCQSLARFELAGIPPMPAGLARVAVTFRIDADGLLTVSAIEKYTGVEQYIEVKPSYGLTTEDIERILKDSYAHGREDMTLRLLTQSRMEAERLLLAVEKALAQDRDLLSAQEAQEITEAMTRLAGTLQQEEYQAIKAAAEHLKLLTQPFADRRMTRSLKDV